MGIAQDFFSKHGYAPSAAQLQTIANGGDPMAQSSQASQNSFYAGIGQGGSTTPSDTPVQGYVQPASATGAAYYTTTPGAGSIKVGGQNSPAPAGGYGTVPTTPGTDVLKPAQINDPSPQPVMASDPARQNPGGGIIGQQMGAINQQSTNGITQQNATSVPGQATNAWNVSAPQTVQGQMTKLIDPNSPYFQQWETTGKQLAAANGFTNGSMQQTGILNSIMQNAAPIAQADAATYAKAAGYNADENNQFGLANATSQNAINQFNASQGNAAELNREGLAQDTGKAQLAANTSLANTRLSTDTQKAISQNDANKGVNMQMQSAVQSLQNTYAVKLAEIQHDGHLDYASKQTAKAQLDTWLNNSISQQGSLAGVNVDSMLAGL